jgi:hypothetical protein
MSLLFADIALLRTFAMAANALALADVYLAGVASRTAGVHARWNGLYLATDAAWLMLIANERFAWLSESEEALYQSATFARAMSRSQFRALLKKGSHRSARPPRERAAVWPASTRRAAHSLAGAQLTPRVPARAAARRSSTAEQPTVLIEQSQPSDVFLILNSDKAHIESNGRTIFFGERGGAPVGAGHKRRLNIAFSGAPTHRAVHEQPPSRPVVVGEASYLTGEPASAKVVVEAGCSYIRWQRDDLRKLDESGDKSVDMWLGLALAEKLRRTTASFVATDEEKEVRLRRMRQKIAQLTRELESARIGAEGPRTSEERVAPRDAEELGVRNSHW